jgi:hypothetical protein
LLDFVFRVSNATLNFMFPLLSSTKRETGNTNRARAESASSD